MLVGMILYAASTLFIDAIPVSFIGLNTVASQ